MASLATGSRAASYENTTSASPQDLGSRIASLDLVRGVVMILMAIDHVRVYSGLPAGGPAPGIFFTRWITHFVAPGFVFLAGTAAYLHGRKLPDKAALSKYLLVRGALLVLLELTVIRVAWTFNLDFSNYMLAGVIWMLGWCMILMAAVIHLPVIAIGITGVAVIALHNLTDHFGPSFGEAGPNWLLKFLYFGGAVQLGNSGPLLLILYVLVPWIGVMMAGYAFGQVMALPVDRRRSICLRLGIALTAAFVLVRALDAYGDPRHWRQAPTPPPAAALSAPAASGIVAPAQPAQPSPGVATQAPRSRMRTVLRFLGTTKYPASLAFLLMTLGPMLILLSVAEGWRGRVAQMTTVFGRVPMFYYLLHIPVIHAAACVVSLIREGRVNPWLFGNHPMAPPNVPEGYAWSLGLLYLVFAVCVVLLYFPSRWFATLRATRRSHWLSYL